MPFLNDKHANAELITFADFAGGLNLARPPESIGEDEMQECVNFEFAPDTGLLRMRGGIMPVYTFSQSVTDIIPPAKDNLLLVKSGQRLYKLALADSSEGNHITDLGLVTGSKPVSYELWGDDGDMVMTFGARLHLYDGERVKAVTSENAPLEAEILSTRAGRVFVAENGSDAIRYSGVGDPERWIEDKDSDAVSIEVGYKDGRGVKAMAPIAGETIVFKCPDGQPEYGRIYRLQGDYPNWSIVPYSHGSAAWNHQAVASVSSDILFLTREGLANLGTVTEYGDFKLGWAGAKINPRMSKTLTADCCLRHLPAKSQVWVLDGKSPDVWCYHYEIGKGAWTILRFPGVVKTVCSSHGDVFLGIGNTVYRMSDDFTSDNGMPIAASLKTRTIVKRNQILVKAILARFMSTLTADAALEIDKYRMPLYFGGQGDRAFTDTDVAFLDDDPLVPADRVAMARARCNIRKWEITPEIVVRNGSFSMSSLVLEIAEV